MAPRERDARRGRDATPRSSPAAGRDRKAGTGKAGAGKAGSGKAGSGKAASGKADPRAAGKTAGRQGSGASPADRRSAKGGTSGRKSPGARPQARPTPRKPQSKARTRAGAGTGGAFGMTGTRRAALLAMVVCALALSIAVPLRTYLAQREELREVTASHETLRVEVAQLEQRKRELADPSHVEAEARRRLHYVRPGETPYIVQLPGDEEREIDEQRPAAKPAQDKAWYEQLWDSAAAR